MHSLKRFPLFLLSLILVWGSGRVAYAADFSDTHDDGLLTGWTIYGSRGWAESGGAAVPEDSKNAVGFLIHEGPTTNNGTFQFTVRGPGNSNSEYAGGIIRFNSVNAFYFISLVESYPFGTDPSNTLYFCKNTTDVDQLASCQVVASGMNLSSYSSEYPITVELQDDTYTFWLGGNLLGQVVDGDHVSGGVGYAYDNTYNTYAQFLESSWTEVPDGDAPVVHALFPADEALRVSYGRQPLQISFNEWVQKGVGNVTIKKSDGSVLETIDVTSNQVAMDDATVFHGFESSTEEWTWGSAIKTRDNTQAHSGSYSLKATTSTDWEQAEAFYSNATYSSGMDWSAYDSVVVWVYSADSGLTALGVIRNGSASWFQDGECTLTTTTWTRCAYSLSNVNHPDKVLSFGLNLSRPGTYYIDDMGLKKAGKQYVSVMPSIPLVANESYSIQIDAGAFVDYFGNAYAGISDETTWNFSTHQTPTDISLSVSSILENQDSGTAVGTFSTTDPDLASPFTYSLISGSGSTHNDLFIIDGSTLKTKQIFDYESQSSYSIRVRSIDYGGLSVEKAFTIAVTNVNDSPTGWVLSPTTMSENAGANAEVGLFNTTDPDAGNTFTYTLVTGAGDTDNGSFNISGDRLRATQSLDYETKNSYTIRVRSTDQGGLYVEDTVVITVLDVNDAPVITSQGGVGTVNFSLSENQLTVGQITATDPDAGTVLTFSIEGGADAALFQIDSQTGEFSFINPPDYELPVDFNSDNVYEVVVRVTDNHATPLYASQTWNITITDEVGVVINSNGGGVSATINHEENQILVTTVVALDEGGASPIYSIGGGVDAARFQIHSSTGMLTFSTAPDYETPTDVDANNVYTVEVVATGAGAATATQVIHVTVTNVNETPTVLSLNSTVVAENAGVNVEVGAFTTTDVDAGNTFTYTLVAGVGDTDNGVFNISGDRLRVTPSLDYETQNSYAIRVRTTDQGGLSTENTFTITVTNVNETPTVLSLNSTVVAENAGVNAEVGAFTTTDPDAGNTFTYTLVAGLGDTDNDVFNISGDRLQVTPSLDYEMKHSYTVRVRSTDQGGLFVESTFAVSVTNVNDNAPVLANQTVSMTYTAAVGTEVASFTATDADGALDPLIYTLVSGNEGGHFAIDPFTGRLTLVTSLSDPSLQTYTLTIQVTDGLFNTQATATISVHGQVPGWDGTQLTIRVEDNVGQRFQFQTWAAGDTLVVYENDGVSFKVALTDPPASPWQVQAQLGTHSWTTASGVDSFTVTGIIQGTGAQTLELIWGASGWISDTLHIPLKIFPRPKPQVQNVRLYGLYTSHQVALSHHENNKWWVPADPDQMVFTFDILDSSGTQLQWNLIEPVSGALTSLWQGKTLSLVWKNPRIDQDSIAAVVTNGYGQKDTLLLGWDYQAALHTINVGASGFKAYQTPEGRIGFQIPQAGLVQIQKINARGALLGARTEWFPAGAHELASTGTHRGGWYRIVWNRQSLVVKTTP